jgi:hypothetical protein
MASKKEKNIEEELIEKRNYIVAEAIDKEVSGNYEVFEKQAGGRISGFREGFKERVENMGLNLFAMVYFLMACQLGVSFVLLLILDLLKVILSLILMLVILGVLVVYLIAYCMIDRHPKKFQNLSSGFLIWIILAICEAIVLCFLSIPISTQVFLLEVSLVICSWFIGFIAAKVKKGEFSDRLAFSCVIGSTLLLYIIWMVCFEYYLWLSLCTVAVVLYEFLMIKQITKVIEKVAEEDLQHTFAAGIYICVLLFKSKVDLGLSIISFVYQKTCKKSENTAN